MAVHCAKTLSFSLTCRHSDTNTESGRSTAKSTVIKISSIGIPGGHLLRGNVSQARTRQQPLGPRRFRRALGVNSSSLSGSSSEDSLITDIPTCHDEDLRFVLEIASDSELDELVDILYGKSLFSPLFKSLTSGDGSDDDLSPAKALFSPSSADVALPLHCDREERVARLEARFFFLAADARATIRGTRPSYRSVLEGVRSRLGVACSDQLATADLESEIFLHLLNNYADSMDEEMSPPPEPSRSAGSNSSSNSSSRSSSSRAEAIWSTVTTTLDSALYRATEGQDGSFTGRQRGSSRNGGWRESVRDFASGTLRSGVWAALRMGRDEILAAILKGGSALTLTHIKRLLLSRITGRVLLERAKYEVVQQTLKQGGKALLVNIETQLAAFSARQGLAAATARYVGLRSAMALLGPVLWGFFIADVVIQSMGSDYARIVRAIFAIAQIRLTRTYGWTQPPSLPSRAWSEE